MYKYYVIDTILIAALHVFIKNDVMVHFFVHVFFRIKIVIEYILL